MTTERNFLYVNQKNGTFKEQGLLFGVSYNEDATTVSAMGADVKDYDNDGWPDVFYNDLMGQIWGLFRNVSGRTFRYVSPATKLVSLSTSYSGWSGGFIDYNNDGWKDVFQRTGMWIAFDKTPSRAKQCFRMSMGNRLWMCQNKWVPTLYTPATNEAQHLQTLTMMVSLTSS